MIDNEELRKPHITRGNQRRAPEEYYKGARQKRVIGSIMMVAAICGFCLAFWILMAVMVL